MEDKKDCEYAISISDAKYACAKAYAEGYTWLHALESCPRVNPVVVHEYTSAKTNLVEKDKVIGILESWREEMEGAMNLINDAICEIEALPTVKAESEEGGSDDSQDNNI